MDGGAAVTTIELEDAPRGACTNSGPLWRVPLASRALPLAASAATSAARRQAHKRPQPAFPLVTAFCARCLNECPEGDLNPHAR